MGQARTVGQAQDEMRELAVQAMREAYQAADVAAISGDLNRAEERLAAAERWRERARSHGARV